MPRISQVTRETPLSGIGRTSAISHAGVLDGKRPVTASGYRVWRKTTFSVIPGQGR
jgi:hypothetical protein